jgi:hypothetical protein
VDVNTRPDVFPSRLPRREVLDSVARGALYHKWGNLFASGFQPPN